MAWKFELDGEGSDKLALRPLASACNCTIHPGPDARPWLGGTKFDGITTREQALEEARKTLALLNGLARLENPQHRPVNLGNEFLQDRLSHYIEPPTSRYRVPRSEVYEYTSPLTGGLVMPPVDPADERRRARIVAEPKLAEILEILAAEITWQRLRVAFEKISALVGNGDNALVKNKYATQDELTSFKANVQDPRHSGYNAVHGIPQTAQLKGTKMTELEGFDFIVRLFNTYVERQIK
jgi:hypothetical protein